MIHRLAILLGSGNAALAILLAAYATHSLKNSWQETRYLNFQTAIDYHLYHALSLIIVGMMLNQRHGSKLLELAAAVMLTGMVFFCGSLYMMSLTGIAWFGNVTPLGGITLIISWFLVMATYLHSKHTG